MLIFVDFADDVIFSFEEVVESYVLLEAYTARVVLIERIKVLLVLLKLVVGHIVYQEALSEIKGRHVALIVQVESMEFEVPDHLLELLPEGLPVFKSYLVSSIVYSYDHVMQCSEILLLLSFRKRIKFEILSK